MRKPRPEPLSPNERAFDLGAWLRQHASLASTRGVEWMIQCPRCGNDKLAVHIIRKAWQCFVPYCGFRGWTPAVLLAAVAGIDLAAAQATVDAGAIGRELGAVAPLQEPERRLGRLLPDAPLPPGLERGLRPEQRAYLEGRGIPAAHIEAMGLGTIHGDGSGSKADRCLASRIFFPAWMDGRVVFWAARAVDDHPAKVMNLPKSCDHEGHPPKCACNHDEWGLRPTPQCAGTADAVIGLHLVQPGDFVVIVEGPVDAVAGGSGFVAICGSKIHDAQVAAILAARPSRVVVMLDGDAAGRGGTPEVAAALRPFVETRIAWLHDGADPGMLGRDESLRYARAASGDDGIPPLTSRRSSANHRLPPFPMIEPLAR